MLSKYTLVALASAAITGAGAIAPAAFAATAEPLGLEADIDARISRERARQASQRSARAEEQRRRDGAECGSLDIGNVNTGGSGFNRVPKEITIVVQGDIVNANNRCRN